MIKVRIKKIGSMRIGQKETFTPSTVLRATNHFIVLEEDAEAKFTSKMEDEVMIKFGRARCKKQG